MASRRLVEIHRTPVLLANPRPTTGPPCAPPRDHYPLGTLATLGHWAVGHWGTGARASRLSF